MTTSTLQDAPTFTAFSGDKRIVSGTKEEVLRATKRHLDASGGAVLIFEDQTGRQIDFDFRGSVDDVIERAIATPKGGPGRPRLGVVSREVSLLPRHWDWLEAQPNGISAAMRRLVDDARHNETGIQRGRHVRDAIVKFMWGIAGDLPNFEEACRSLYERDDARLASLIAEWPADVRDYVLQRVGDAALIEGW
jgi:uncharacterized protein